MTVTMRSHTWPSFSPLLFARDSDQDLEFDDEWEEDDDPGYKPPRRRWFKFLLLMLLAIGTWYVVTDPERRSFVIRMMPDTMITTFGIDTEDSIAERKRHVPPAAQEPPVPAFHEGQRVTVGSKEGRQVHFRLRNEAQGQQLGPVVKTGDVLTIIDGSLSNTQWIYFVHTETGKSGWIKQSHIQSQS